MDSVLDPYMDSNGQWIWIGDPDPVKKKMSTEEIFEEISCLMSTITNTVPYFDWKP
jgi:hypothetical protein